MLQNTFVHKTIEQDGGVFHLLTAQEYPWLNIQIIPFPEAEHDDAIAKLNAAPTIGWVIEYPSRRDFAVIHAGGATHHLNITQANHEQVAADMQQCMRNAAKWWADHNPTSNF